MAKTPKVIRTGDLKPRNKTVQQAVVRRWGSGVHKGSKADQDKKACRGKPKLESMVECLAAVNLMMLELCGKK